MEPFIVHHGQDAPLLNNNIDTDQIIPKAFLKRIERTGYGKNLFDEWRFLPDGTENIMFILNQLPYRKASILITGDNFGCGSSREHAAWALKDFGFRVVIAGSFSDIFYMNALKNGLLPVILPENVRRTLADSAKLYPIKINLLKQQVECQQQVWSFEINQTWKEKLLQGMDDIAITLKSLPLIETYENQTIYPLA